jgi:hypothetical protein
MGPKEKYFSHPSFGLLIFFLTPPIKLKLQIGGRLLIAYPTWTKSNYLDYQREKQGALNKYDLTLLIRFLQGSSGALKAVHFVPGLPTVFPTVHS